MIVPPASAQIVLALLAALSAGWDVYNRTIPNWITIPALVAGLIIQPKAAILGALLGFALQMGAWLMNWVGGGDVKLMTAAGALVGWEGLLFLLIVSSVIQGLIALIALAIKRGKVEGLPRGPSFALAAALWKLAIG